MIDAIPTAVMYIKNGAGGRWWKVARDEGQVHADWKHVPSALLETADFPAIEPIIRSSWGFKPGATQNINALRSLIDRPSQYLWVTLESEALWWCTVHDKIQINPEGETKERGHFWLNCALPWSNYSLGHQRFLAASELPGIIVDTLEFKGVVSEPHGWREILRVIHNREDADARAAAAARLGYELAVAKLIARLQTKDFELLVDLVLSRTGWMRVAKLGGVTKGVDIEVENPSTNEIAFVQIRSVATQTTLDDYVSRFKNRTDRYHRMIFVVHTPRGNLKPPTELPVQVWTEKDISDLVVRLGLGDWVAKRV